MTAGPAAGFETREEPEGAILIQLVERDRDRAVRLVGELEQLVRTVGLRPLASQLVALSHPSPATLLGKGRIETLAQDVEDSGARVVVFNNPVSPVQQRNLERSLKAKVIDRTGLILEIFSLRARTREGRLQVELASLLYQQSRLVRSWTHLERQRGGLGQRGGPGETQIEVDRRLIRQRINRLEKSLKEVTRTRSLHRRERREIPLFTVALVGYTNAGKSTLFNRLTRAGVDAEDKLFATLDPTVRAVTLPGGGRALLSDTVGFIRDLPHQLVAAFRATLEEVREADLLLHVVDLSDPQWREQRATVLEVLQELESHRKPMLTLYNKIDLLDADAGGLPERLEEQEASLAISAHTGTGVAAMLERLEREVSREWGLLRLEVPVTEGALLARLCREGRVLEQRDGDEVIQLTVALPAAARGRLAADIEKYSPAS
ncbi:MAG: GTPase HflX [Magnetococcales bacterium]|nr:GTPase HflX [Magnetococcales bacterium]